MSQSIEKHVDKNYWITKFKHPILITKTPAGSWLLEGPYTSIQFTLYLFDAFFQVISYSHSFEDYWFHVGNCPTGWGHVGNSGAGTCSGCDHDNYCKRTQTISGGGTETRPKNMRVVYIMKIK